MSTNSRNMSAIQSLAVKIGLGSEEKVISKAAEFERRLQMKSTSSYNISDMGKVVICLDLAATALGVEFDTKTLIKYSGLKPLLYTNSKKVLENLLELNCDKLTVPLLCANLHCDRIQELAQKVLECYQKTTKMEVDLNLPQYVCMAVYQACRVNKVKVAKSKLIEKSRLKPGQFSKMEAEWTKIVDLHFAVANKKKGQHAAKVLDEDEPIEKMEIDSRKDDDETEPQVEPYEHWKRRILAAAYAALDKQVTDDMVVPDNDTRNQVTDLKHVKDKERKKDHVTDSHMTDTNLKVINTDLKLLTDKDRKVTLKFVYDTDRRVKVTDKNDHKYVKDRKLNDKTKQTDKSKLVTDVDKQETDRRKLTIDRKDQMVTKKIFVDNKLIKKNTVSPKRINLTKHKAFDVDMDDDQSDGLLIDRMNRRVDKTSALEDKKDKLPGNRDQRKLNLDDDIFCLSPRRSPRKTPQKYDPYKSPIKNKGVRLLFPSD